MTHPEHDDADAGSDAPESRPASFLQMFIESGQRDDPDHRNV